MSKTELRECVRKAIEESGSGWVFRFWGEEAERNLNRIGADLQAFMRQYTQRFGEQPDPFDLLKVNPQKGAAFFQIDTLMLSVEMKIMVWRVLLGCQIVRVEFKYHAGKEPSLLIILQPPYAENEERYVSQHAADYRVLRHFGTAGVNGKLILDGYYAVRGTV